MNNCDNMEELSQPETRGESEVSEKSPNKTEVNSNTDKSKNMWAQWAGN